MYYLCDLFLGRQISCKLIKELIKLEIVVFLAM